MVTIKRRKDIGDYILPYRCILNGVETKIYAGQTKEIELKKDVSYLEIRLFYLKTNKILLKKGVATTITLGSCVSNIFTFLTVPIFVIGFLLMTFTDYQLDMFYSISKYVAIFYISVHVYFSTFGYRKYITIKTQFEKEY